MGNCWGGQLASAGVWQPASRERSTSRRCTSAAVGADVTATLLLLLLQLPQLPLPVHNMLLLLLLPVPMHNVLLLLPQPSMQQCRHPAVPAALSPPWHVATHCHSQQ